MLHYSILQLQSEEKKLPSRRSCTKILQNKGALDLGWKGSFKIAKVLTPGAYKLSYLNGEQIPRSWNADNLKM